MPILPWNRCGTGAQRSGFPLSRAPHAACRTGPEVEIPRWRSTSAPIAPCSGQLCLVGPLQAGPRSGQWDEGAVPQMFAGDEVPVDRPVYHEQ